MPISYEFEFYDTFNYQLMKIKESGLLPFIVKSYENKYGGISRTCENPKREKGSAIDFYTIISPIIIYIGGLLLSFFLIISEIWWAFWKKKKETKQEIFQYSSDSAYHTKRNNTNVLILFSHRYVDVHNKKQIHKKYKQAGTEPCQAQISLR